MQKEKKENEGEKKALFTLVSGCFIIDKTYPLRQNAAKQRRDSPSGRKG